MNADPRVPLTVMPALTSSSPAAPIGASTMTTTTDAFPMPDFRAFYTVRVTDYPEGSRYGDDDELGREFVEDWRPDGWLSEPDKRAWWVEQFGDDRFFWPKANRLYQTWESAHSRAELFRSYGATAEVVVCNPTWRVAEDPKVARAKARKDKRIAKLRAQIAEIEA